MIRPGGLGDAGALAGIQVRAWQRTFADLVHPELMPDVGEQTGAWTEAFAAGAEALIADVAGSPRGFSATGTARDEDAGAGTAEIYGLFVEPAAQGAGLGSALLEATVGALRLRGAPSAVLWTPVDNPARDWLVRQGWIEDTDPVEEHGPLGVREIRHRRGLP